RRPPISPLFPYTTLFRSGGMRVGLVTGVPGVGKTSLVRAGLIPQLSQRGALAVYLTDYADFEGDLGRALARAQGSAAGEGGDARSEEHTSELQSRSDLVC